ncbi:MAG: hypothetical protein J1E16_05930 [Muribaculaceae bacterium]|nr:hypothetical protein [Muribaculaceae bacterium]
MKLQVIKTQNGNEIMNFTRELKSSEDLMSMIENIRKYTDRKKVEIISQGFPFEEINDGNFKGFISETFQVITTGNRIDITEGNINMQFNFLPSLGMVSHPILAA